MRLASCRSARFSSLRDSASMRPPTLTSVLGLFGLRFVVVNALRLGFGVACLGFGGDTGRNAGCSARAPVSRRVRSDRMDPGENAPWMNGAGLVLMTPTGGGFGSDIT